jgi:hypothetical protein
LVSQQPGWRLLVIVRGAVAMSAVAPGMVAAAAPETVAAAAPEMVAAAAPKVAVGHLVSPAVLYSIVVKQMWC